MKEFEDIVTSAYAVLLSLIGLFLIFRFVYYIKTQHARIKIGLEKTPFHFFRFLSIVAIPLFLIGLINYIFILQKGNLFAPYWAKVGLIALLFLVAITEILYNIYLRPTKFNRILNIVFGLVFLFLGIQLNKVYLTAKEYPSVESSVIIDLPFEGQWIASGAGASGLTNHHDRINSQKYAVDIVKFGENGRLFENEGIENEDSYTFGAEIVAPVNGKVVHVVDSLPDQKITDRDKLAGNHIIIQFQDTLFVALAHLKQNSIAVKPGAVVKVGDFLALVGNSGNTDFPHLHVHVQNSKTYDIETTISYPFRFKNFKRMRYFYWENQRDQFLLSNDIIKPQ